MQAMPHGLTMMCSGFVLIWCLLLPFGLWEREPNVIGVLGMALVSMMLLVRPAAPGDAGGCHRPAAGLTFLEHCCTTLLVGTVLPVL